jgi:hypothetical protein
MTTGRLSHARIIGLACRGALVAGVLLSSSGCTGAVTRPEESMPLTQHNFRRFSGGTARIFDMAKQALGKMGVLVTGERPGEAIHGRVDIARQPVFVYVRIAGGNRVYVTVYNLKDKDADEYRLKVYEAMEAVARSTPGDSRGSDRGRRG